MDLQRIKQLAGINESAKPITPTVKYKENGDKSWTVRVEYDSDHVYVHTNKKRSVLEQIVKDRYGPKVFH